MNKEIITWNPDLSTGLEQVDKEHKELVAVINEVAPCLIGSPVDPTKNVPPLLERLMKHAITHFNTEESLMQHYQVDARSQDRHHRIHAGFIDRMTELTDISAGQEMLNPEDLLSFLSGRMIHHVLGEDQSMARQIHAIDSGMTPEQAYREAGGYRSDPSEEALARLLIHMYKRLIHARKAGLSPTEG